MELTVRSGPSVGGSTALAPGRPVVIGRVEGADLVVDDPRVSRLHCRVALGADGVVRVEDLGSRNGTFVDEERVAPGEAVPLAPGAILRLAGTGGPELGLALPPGQPAPPPDAPAGVADEARVAAPPAPGPSPVPPAGQAPPDASRLGRLSAIHEVPRGRFRIGRAPDNDLVVDDLRVSRYHAELRGSAGGQVELDDLGSRNGTWVNGRRIGRAVLADGDLVGIGGATCRLVAGRLEQYVDAGAAWLVADGLQVTLHDGRRLLDGVTFALEPASLLAIVGPSGAGKTTLLGALTGVRPADGGTVLFGGRDLYAAYGELRQRIGLVPQDDILHGQLTVRQALGYAAELRFPSDAGSDARKARIAEVLEELGLADRANVRIDRLSGGQRKRTSVAVELLARPSLLFLDEPTSGLDPGREASLMGLLRDLARGGRTVVVVTHSLQSLGVCDRVLFLAPGGRVAFYGPPDASDAYFAAHGAGRTPAEVFRAVDERHDIDWAAAYAADGLADRYVRAPLARLPRQPQPATPVQPEAPAPASPTPPRAPSAPVSGVHQFLVLVRRHLAILRSDPGVLALLAVQAPIFGLLIWALFRTNVFSSLFALESSILAWLLAVAATWLGTSNAIREVVKELPIYRRERAIGLSPVAYLASKFAVLSGITILQVALLVPIATFAQRLPALDVGYAAITTDPAAGEVLSGLLPSGTSLPGATPPLGGVMLGDPRLELFVVLVLTGLAAIAVGLALSAVMRSADRVATLLPLVLVAQVIASAPLLGPPPAGIRELGFLSSTQWGLSAVASTIGLNEMRAPFLALQNAVRYQAGVLPELDLQRGLRSFWVHDPLPWLADIAALLVITVLALLAARAALRRLDPNRGAERPVVRARGSAVPKRAQPPA